MEPLRYVERHVVGIHLTFKRVPRGLTIETVYTLAPESQWDALLSQAQRCAW